MAEEFVSVDGKVILEREVLFFRTIKFSSLTETVFFKIFAGVSALALFVTAFFYDNDFDLFRHLILSILLLIWFIPPLYDILFKRSLSARIPLSRIASYELKDDGKGLETTLKLHLRSGRYKAILFRTLEKQYEPLVNLISQHSTQPQFA
ncbi:MAG TPA: hypothetical protein VEY06_13390 [Flavisolibacter sp.]|nr:hypothetical protein [Flavisolibacter sp.]